MAQDYASALDIAISGAVDAGDEVVIIGGEEFIIGVAKTATVTIGATTFDVVMTGTSIAITNTAGVAVAAPNADWTALLRTIDYRHDGTLVSTTVGARTLALTAEDLAGNTQSSLTTIDVTTNNTPVDDDETAAPTEDTPFSVPAATGLLANATDVEGDPISISGYTIAGVTGTQPVGTPVTIPSVGDLTINADGSYDFTPAADFSGPVPVITYSVTDGFSTDTSTLTLAVTNVNDDPTASAAPLTPTEDTPATGAITATDVDGDPLTYTLSTPPANGTVALNPDGTFTYTPDPGFNGSDPFTVTVDDGNGGTIDVTVPVSVGAVNDDPVASAAPLTPTEDTPATGAITATDPDGDPLTYTLSTPPANGTVTLNPDGTFSYTPDADYNGSDDFVVTVDDGNGGTVDVTVPVTVAAVNDDPTASAAPLTPSGGHAGHRHGCCRRRGRRSADLHIVDATGQRHRRPQPGRHVHLYAGPRLQRLGPLHGHG